MNFYASPGYLESVAEVYYKNRLTTIEDVRVGNQILRLLVVDKKYPVTKSMFLDYHLPLHDSEITSVVRKANYATSVALSAKPLCELQELQPKDGDVAPYVDWSLFPTYDDYKAFILGRNRGLVRERERRGRRLAEVFGKPTFTMHDDQEDVFPLAQEWKSGQLLRSGSVDWITDPQVIELLNVLRRKGLLVCSTLRVSERLAAVWIGFIYDNCWSGWIFTHNPQLSKYSAGHHLVNAMLEESYKLKHREFDFSCGDEDYKMIYATHARLLGEAGRMPLSQRLLIRLKQGANNYMPHLIQRARDLRKEGNSRAGVGHLRPVKLGHQG